MKVHFEGWDVVEGRKGKKLKEGGGKTKTSFHERRRQRYLLCLSKLSPSFTSSAYATTASVPQTNI